MKLALIGATGFVGKAVLEEALNRGHDVTAIARDPERVSVPAALRARLTVVKGDINDPTTTAGQIRGCDALISAYNAGGYQGAAVYEQYVSGTRHIIDAARQAGVLLLAVGGAGSLFVAPGAQLVDTPEFPAEWKDGALGAREALNILQQESGLDWTMISPSAMLEPGPRTGQFRLGGDELLMDGDQPARISVADLAVALVDEVEQGHYRNARFTAGY